MERVRFHTAALKPALIRLAAIGAPMMPVPSTAIVIVMLSI